MNGGAKAVIRMNSWYFLGSPVRTTITADNVLCDGKRLEMYCNATGSPEPSIKWEKGNTFLSYSK